MRNVGPGSRAARSWITRFAAVALGAAALLVTSVTPAKADRGWDDDGWRGHGHRYDRYDHRYDHRGYGRGYGYGYRTNYYYPGPRAVVVLPPPPPFFFPPVIFGGFPHRHDAHCGHHW
jgi:hypothetical protein